MRQEKRKEKVKYRMKKEQKEKGITLIALVITIIVMIILAGTTLSILFGENGVITKAKQAKSEYERAGRNEQIAIEELQNSLNNMGTGGSQPGQNSTDNETGGGTVDPTPSYSDIQIDYEPTTPRNTSTGNPINGVERGPIKVTIKYGETNLINSNRYQYKIGEENWESANQNYEFTITKNTTIYARYNDGVNTHKETSKTISNVDNEGPAAFTPTLESKTTNNITIKGETTDVSGIKGYQFSKDNGSSWTEEQTENRYTYSSLISNEAYQIKIKAIDKAGNETISNTLEVVTEEIPGAEGNISRKETWENGKLKIELATNQASYPIEYKIDEGTWKNYTQPVQLNLNQTIYYRLTDGQNNGAEANRKAEDGIKPTGPNITVIEGSMGQNNWYTSNVTIKITQGTDNESGIERTTYTLTGAQAQAETEIANNGNVQITSDGSTTIAAYSYDKAGNKSEAETKEIKKDTNTPSITVSPQTITQTINPGESTSPVEVTIKVEGSTSRITKTEYNFTEDSTTAPKTWKSYTNNTKISENLEGGTYYLWSKTTTESGREETRKIGNSYTINYKISYNLNGGTTETEIAEQIKTKNQNITLSNIQPNKEGYTFLGWDENQAATTASYPVGGSYSQNKATTLYAIWRKTITISYNANGGTAAPSTQTGNVFNNTTSMNFTIATTIPKRGNYIFIGWSTNSTATTATYHPGESYSFSDSITLYAIWSAMPKIGINTKAEENSTINGEKGTAQNPIIPKGFKAINEGEASWKDGTSNPAYDKGLVIEDATNDATTKGSQFVWVPVQNYDNFIQKEGYFEGNIDTKLPQCNNEQDLVTPEATDMFTSVQKNEGFYIARYEMGIDTITTVTTSNHNTIADGTIKPVSKAGRSPWNYIPWGGTSTAEATDGFQGNDLANGAVKVARSMYPNLNNLSDYALPSNITNQTGVISTLIYGTQWDAAMTFLSDVTNTNAGNVPYIQDSTNMGNYSRLKTTGQYKVKNIYDLAGNVEEWTMEKYNFDSRVRRGGNYEFGSGFFNPASERNGVNPYSSNIYNGARIALYL